MKSLSWLITGLFLYGIALALLLRASLGVGPWNVLTSGLVEATGISFGLMTNLIGLGVLLVWIPLRQRPGIGTVLNVLLVGTSADIGLWLIPPVSGVFAQVAVFAAGLSLLAAATGIYIAPGLGPGPRDGLMTGLHERTGAPVWLCRAGVEITVLAVGWLLGGLVGIGTVAEALLIGPMVHRTLPFFRTVYAGRSAAAEVGAETRASA
ncbi:YitT family protein [Nocardioides sp. NPDC057577]|uniref:membrane protein YczE n=1 Tax=Nocardioides sp. NPDC057577 TaxID=3346171 RepID=UPI00366A7AB9